MDSLYHYSVWFQDFTEISPKARFIQTGSWHGHRMACVACNEIVLPSSAWEEKNRWHFCSKTNRQCKCPFVRFQRCDKPQPKSRRAMCMERAPANRTSEGEKVSVGVEHRHQTLEHKSSSDQTCCVTIDVCAALRFEKVTGGDIIALAANYSNKYGARCEVSKSFHVFHA